jgi:hypothetical protein
MIGRVAHDLVRKIGLRRRQSLFESCVPSEFLPRPVAEILETPFVPNFSCSLRC